MLSSELLDAVQNFIWFLSFGRNKRLHTFGGDRSQQGHKLAIQKDKLGVRRISNM